MPTNPAPPDQALRQHVLYMLRGGGAHVKFDDAIKDLPAELRGKRPAGAEHSPWEVLEHMRIAQWDILEFSRDANHKSPSWPEGYWPNETTPASEEAWQQSVDQFHADLELMCELVGVPQTDLFAKIPHGEGQTILREALLIADHNAYHLGELVLLRRLLGAWS